MDRTWATGSSEDATFPWGKWKAALRRAALLSAGTGQRSRSRRESDQALINKALEIPNKTKSFLYPILFFCPSLHFLTLFPDKMFITLAGPVRAVTGRTRGGGWHWTSSGLLCLQERISPFCEAGKSQVVGVPTQNAARRVSHVEKLIGGGRKTTQYCPEENVREASYWGQYMRVYMYVQVCVQTHREQDHTVVSQPELRENTAWIVTVLQLDEVLLLLA